MTERWFVVVLAEGDRYEVAELVPNARPYSSHDKADEEAVRLRAAREDAAAREVARRLLAS
jgi:hypothetical protein